MHPYFTGDREKNKIDRRKRDTVRYRLRFDVRVKISLKANVFYETRLVTDVAPGADFQFEKDRARLPSD